MIDFSEKEPEKGATAKRMASLSFAVPTKEDALRCNLNVFWFFFVMFVEILFFFSGFS